MSRQNAFVKNSPIKINELALCKKDGGGVTTW